MLMVFNAAQTIGYYGFASWVPTLLIARGITTTTSLAYSFAIALAAPVGPLIVSRFADRLDRRWQIALSAAAIALVGLAFAQASGVALILLGVLLTCSNNWMSVAFHAYQAELFPTDIRAQAVGFVYTVEPVQRDLHQSGHRRPAHTLRRHWRIRLHCRRHGRGRRVSRHLRPAYTADSPSNTSRAEPRREPGFPYRTDWSVRRTSVCEPLLTSSFDGDIHPRVFAQTHTDIAASPLE